MSFISKKLKILFLTVILISGAIVASGYIYYRGLNSAEDPRIVDARHKMMEYNNYMGEGETGLALLILDQVEDIYTNTPGYKNSYELGVVLNNRGSIFLIKAETDIINNEVINTDNLMQAKQYIEGSIDIYANWLETITPLERGDIRNMIAPFFHEGDFAFAGRDLEKIIEKRVEDIMASKLETKRRLSVSYTNLGIISRYEGNLEQALMQYETAVGLWPNNHVAEDNITRLLGRIPEKRNIIKQMFFKDKNKT